MLSACKSTLTAAIAGCRATYWGCIAGTGGAAGGGVIPSTGEVAVPDEMP